MSENSSLAEGSGIGLALAQGIMNLHHGHIEAKSRVGEGTTFVLTLQLGCSQFDKEEIAGVHDEKTIRYSPKFFRLLLTRKILMFQKINLTQRKLIRTLPKVIIVR